MYYKHYCTHIYISQLLYQPTCSRLLYTKVVISLQYNYTQTHWDNYITGIQLTSHNRIFTVGCVVLVLLYSIISYTVIYNEFPCSTHSLQLNQVSEEKEAELTQRFGNRIFL